MSALKFIKRLIWTAAWRITVSLCGTQEGQNFFLKSLLRTFFWFRDLCLRLVSTILNPKYSDAHGAHHFFLRHIPSGSRVLDVGCGNGQLTWRIAQKAAHVDAYDNDEKSIAEAKRSRSAGNITYYCADIYGTVRPEFPTYDVVVMGAVLSFIPDPMKFLQALRPHTKLILIRETKYDNDILAVVARDLGVRKSTWKEFSKVELVSLIKSAGYQLIEDADSYDMFLAAR